MTSRVDSEILAPADGEPREGVVPARRVEIRLKHVPKKIDPTRILNLIEHIAIPWLDLGKGRVTIVARSLTSKTKRTPQSSAPVSLNELEEHTIEDVYYMALLYDDEAGFIHVAAERPQKVGQLVGTDSLYLWDARRGVNSGGEVEVDWDKVMRDKATAYAFGAEPLRHVGDIYGRALQKLQDPLKPLRRRERLLGSVATDYLLPKNN